MNHTSCVLLHGTNASFNDTCVDARVGCVNFFSLCIIIETLEIIICIDEFHYKSRLLHHRITSFSHLNRVSFFRGGPKSQILSYCVCEFQSTCECYINNKLQFLEFSLRLSGTHQTWFSVFDYFFRFGFTLNLTTFSSSMYSSLHALRDIVLIFLIKLQLSLN